MDGFEGDSQTGIQDGLIRFGWLDDFGANAIEWVQLSAKAYALLM